MAMYYSGSTRGFYDSDFHAEIPGDCVEITPERYAFLMQEQAGGKEIVPSHGTPVAVAPPPPSAAQIQAQLTAVVQAHLDAQAQALGYDSIFTAVTYADEPAVPKFQADGQALRAWRSLVWEAGYALLAQVQAGEAPIPTPEALIASLPAFGG